MNRADRVEPLRKLVALVGSVRKAWNCIEYVSDCLDDPKVLDETKDQILEAAVYEEAAEEGIK